MQHQRKNAERAGSRSKHEEAASVGAIGDSKSIGQDARIFNSALALLSEACSSSDLVLWHFSAELVRCGKHTRVPARSEEQGAQWRRLNL